VIVHDAYWTATARHADIVLPATITLERNDLGAAGSDAHLVAMHRVVAPFEEARDDYQILSGLARELGCEEAFTEGRTADDWLRSMYDVTRDSASMIGHDLPTFDEFWALGEVDLPVTSRPTRVEAFRADPVREALTTPSGRVELWSATIAAFETPDAPGHPAWREPREWHGSALAARYPLVLIANQPARRLHSQLDFGAHSQDGKRDGREVLRIHPADAAGRGIADGDVVRVANDRGALLATATVSDLVMPGVVQLPTGAWYTPAMVDGRLTCVHGNPNAVTSDRGTSSLAQGSTGQHCLVEVERFDGAIPDLDPYAPPPIARLA
jgi:biotin/methionine sulfoxide reductase